MSNAQHDSPTKPLNLHENTFFSVYFDGKRHFVDFPEAVASAIAISRFANGDYLLVRRARAPLFGQSIEFPRGWVFRGKDPNQEARRELLEKTGISVEQDATMFLGKVGGDTSVLNHETHVFLVDIPVGVEEGAYRYGEIEEYLRVTPAIFKQMVRDNRIADAQTLAAYALLLSRL